MTHATEKPGFLATYLPIETWCAILTIVLGCTDSPQRTAVQSPRPSALPAPTAVNGTGGQADQTRPHQGYLYDPAQALVPFYEALTRSQHASATGDDGRVLIAQFGDSHTAGDNFTRRLRQVLQKRFGDGGRGFLLPGKPLRHYYQQGADFGVAGRWATTKGWKSDATGPIGIGGIRVDSTRRSRELWVGTCKRCETADQVDAFEIFFAKSDKSSSLQYRVDQGRWRTVNTRRTPADVGATGFVRIDVKPPGKHRLTIRPKDRRRSIGLFGVALERKQPGVIIDGLGIVGLQILHLHRLEWQILGEQLAQRNPALVVLQYGNNEADDDDLDLGKLEQRYIETIARIRQSAPKAGILVLGPPDMGNPELGHSTCRRLRKKLDKKRRRSRNDTEDDTPVEIPGCSYQTPALLPDIVATQKRVSRAQKVAFFDSFRALGGANMMDDYYRQDPPLAYSDRVHFTKLGANLWANVFVQELLTAYETWRKSRR